jgi:phage repressor protein C with HTH and peptisase S24 domain
VISDNPRYPVQELPADDLTVIGRIVWIVARKV